LKCDGGRHTGKFAFILKLLESDLLGLVDHTLDFKVVLLRINLGDTTMVTNKVILVGSNLSLTELGIARICKLWSCTCLN
jgi:hypothetical protein